MRSMDPRDVAIMAVVDLVNAGRCVLLQGTSDVPDARILAAGMAQLHLADRSEVPVAEALQEEVSEMTSGRGAGCAMALCWATLLTCSAGHPSSHLPPQSLI